MNDYLDQIDVKGVLYTISGGAGSGVTSGEVQTMLEDYTYDKEYINNLVISGGGMTSGEVQTMIDESISGKVNVGDAVTSLDMSDSAWADGKIQLLFFKGLDVAGKDILTVGDGLSIDSGRTISVTGGGITSGEVQTMIDESISGKADDSGVTFHTEVIVPGERGIEYSFKGQPYEILYQVGSGLTFNGLDNKITLDSTVVQTQINQSISGKADSSDVYLKTETYTKTEVDNKVWCGDSQAWSQISGSTQSGTLYLIY